MDETNHGLDWRLAARNKYVDGIGLPFADARVVSHNSVVANGTFGEIAERLAATLNRTFALAKVKGYDLAL